MLKSGSFNSNSKLNQIFCSNDSYLLEDDEIYQLIKEDFHEKQMHKALSLVKPYLHISFSEEKKDNLYHTILKESSNKYKNTLKSFSHFRIEEDCLDNTKKFKNSLKIKKRNKIPLPYLKTNASFNSSKSNFSKKKGDRRKNNVLNTEIQNNNNQIKINWKKRSLSSQNITFESNE